MNIGRMTKFDKLIVLTLLMIFDTMKGVYADEIKVRSGDERSLTCSSTSGTYEWRIDGTLIDDQTSGIDSDTVGSSTLRIRTMTQQLAGTYVCSRNGDMQATFDVKIVVLAEYGICQNGPQDCRQNFIYSTSTTRFELNASIVFDNCGNLDNCCNEGLADPEWLVIVPPGQIGSGTEVTNLMVSYSPGINITIETSEDLVTSIATLNITNANVPFEIMHLIHTNVDGQDGEQRTIIFNFNYTESPTPSTTSSHMTPTDSSTTSTTAVTPTATFDISFSSTPSTSSTTNSETANISSTNTRTPSTLTSSSGTPIMSPDTGGTASMDDGDSSTGVAIGVAVAVVVACIIVVLVIIAVVIVYRHVYHKQQGDAATPSSSANGVARPSGLPLLQYSGKDAYTFTATPQPNDVAPSLCRNGNSNVTSDNVHHQGNDGVDGHDDEQNEPVDADCFGPEAVDSPAVEVRIFK